MEEKMTLLMDIYSLATKINDNTSYCVFVNFYGHVEDLDISIAESKENYREKERRLTADTGIKRYTETEEAVISSLTMMRDDLEEFYDEALSE